MSPTTKPDPFRTDDDELVPQMHDDLYDGLKDEIVEP
jgi:hypothetical protein